MVFNVPVPSMQRSLPCRLKPACAGAGREAFLFASAVAVLGSCYHTRPQLQSSHADAAKGCRSLRRRAPDMTCGTLAKAFRQLQALDAAYPRTV